MKTFGYRLVKSFHNWSGSLFLGMCALSVNFGLESILEIEKISDVYHIGRAVAAGGLAFITARCALKIGATKALLYLDKSEIAKNHEKYNLENVSEIVIDDMEGLEILLEKTNEKKIFEWGTFLKSYDDKGKAVVSEILDFEEAKEQGLVSSSRPWRIISKKNLAKEKGYNGFHHYHPSIPGLASANYSIHCLDRYSLMNWLNLLSFNMPDGPEIIGYNRNYTYLPKDKSKKHLIQATNKQIIEYIKSLQK